MGAQRANNFEVTEIVGALKRGTTQAVCRVALVRQPMLIINKMNRLNGYLNVTYIVPATRHRWLGEHIELHGALIR